jgi:hypothetical protein
MNARITIAAAIACVALSEAGCGGGGTQAGHTATATTASATATAVSPAPTSPSPIPSQAATVLTISQARAIYQRIVDPGNRATDAVNTDSTDAAPLSQFRADVARVIAADRTFAHQLRACRWPARVQPYISAMLLTDLPDTIACYTAIERAPSYGDAQVVNETNQSCIASSGSNNADQVWALLGLPARS